MDSIGTSIHECILPSALSIDTAFSPSSLFMVRDVRRDKIQENPVLREDVDAPVRLVAYVTTLSKTPSYIS